MAASTYFTQVEQLYIAFYQRPADPAGLLYWSQRIDAAKGDTSAVVDAFGTSAESVALYGAITSTNIGTVIDAIYTALFGRVADAAGKAFYIAEFTAGRFTPASIALNVFNGATADDAVALTNKTNVAMAFTQQVDGRALTASDFGTGSAFAVTYTGDADNIAARTILKTVTSSPATVLNGAGVTNELKSKIANAGDTILGTTAGQTFTLTTGIDILNGTVNDDVFIGSIAAPVTVSGADQITGGAGNDTLKIYGGVTLPTFSGIETLFVSAPGATLSVAALTEVTRLEIDSDSTGYAWTLNANQNIGLTAVTGAGTVVTLTTTDAALDATVNGVAAAGVTPLLVEFKGAALATLNLTTAGSASNITLENTASATSLKTLNVSGTAAVTLDANTKGLTGITTVNAAGNSGNVSYVASDAKVKFTGGTGADTITFAATKLTVDDVVDGGAGVDAIVVNDTAFTSGTTDQVKGVNKSTNVETLAFATAGVTVDKDVITATAITNFRADVGGGTYTFNNTLSANTVEVNAVTIGANDFTIANKLGETASNLKVTATSAAIGSVAQLKLVGISTLNIDSGFTGTGSQATANLVTLTAQSDNTVFNVKGAQAVNLTALAGATTTGSTLDASAATGKVGLTGTNKADILKGGTAADTLNGLQGADTLTGGAGADTFSFTATAAANANGATFGTFDTITDFVAGTDKLQFAGVTDVVSGQQAGVQAAVTALAAGSSATAIATAMAAANTTNLGVSFAVFEGNTYVLYETTGAGAGVIADDVFIKLTGVATLPSFAADVTA